MVNLSYLDYLGFRKQRLKSIIYFKLKILIPFVVTASIIRQNMYDMKFLRLIGFIFGLRIGLIFQYTLLQSRSWCAKYICILNTIFSTYVQTKSTFQKISVICVLFVVFCEVNVFFVYFHDLCICISEVFQLWHGILRIFLLMPFVNNHTKCFQLVWFGLEVSYIFHSFNWWIKS